MNDKLGKFLRKINYNLNYSQHTLPINLDDNKYRTRKCCRAYIRSELKCTPNEKMPCVFLKWTILQMELDSDFKK